MPNEMKVYELKDGAGAHKMRGEDEDGNPVNESMQPGERVRSAKPLHRLFPNKFVCVDDIKKKVPVRGPISEPVRPAGLRKKAAEVDFQEEEDFEAPETFEPDIDHTSDPEQGKELPMSKSEKKRAKEIKRAAKKAGKVVDDSKEPEEFDDSEAGVEDEDEAGEERGTDVTEDTEGAAEKDLKVFFKDKYYSVYDADEDTPRNEKPLTKTQLAKFVKDYQG